MRILVSGATTNNDPPSRVLGKSTEAASKSTVMMMSRVNEHAHSPLNYSKCKGHCSAEGEQSFLSDNDASTTLRASQLCVGRPPTSHLSATSGRAGSPGSLASVCVSSFIRFFLHRRAAQVAHGRSRSLTRRGPDPPRPPRPLQSTVHCQFLSDHGRTQQQLRVSGGHCVSHV